MRVKICGIQNETDLQTVVAAGADAVGFLVGQLHKSASFILPSTAGRLAGLLPPYIAPVIVTHLSDTEEIMEILNRSGIYCVQLHGASKEQVFKLRDKLPENGKIILAEYVEEMPENNDLDELYSVLDAIVLDCYNKSPGLIGATDAGKSYEWRVGAEIAANCPVPVILAGGLDDQNVAAAVATIRPFGVDAGNKLKDPTTNAIDQNKARNYVKNAKTAFFSIT